MSERNPEPYEEITPPSQEELNELEDTDTDYSDPLDVHPPELVDDEDLEIVDDDGEVDDDNYDAWLPTDGSDVDWDEEDQPPPDPQSGYHQD